ncbi:MAG: EAL domain-containing protein [Gammaproteobacteria bacterium]
MHDSPYTILIVDDAPTNLFTLEALLKRMDNCTVVQAESGEAALAATLEQAIDLILLDIQMPGMDGYETAQLLKKTSRTRDIPIIFVTAVFKSEEFIKRGYAVGAVDYLTKPLDDNLLLNRVEMHRSLRDREIALQIALDKLKQSSEESFRDLFEGSMDAIAIADLEHGFVDCNARAVELFGCSFKQQLLNIHPGRVSPLFQPNGRNSVELANEYLQQALTEGSAQFEWVHQKLDGSLVTVDILLSPVNWHGRPAIQASMRDITERKQAERALYLTRFSIDAASDALFWITPDARIVDANATACKALGYSQDELLKMQVFDIDPNYRAEIWPQHFAELRQSGSLKFESTHQRRDGSQFPVEIVANYIQLDGEEYNCAFIRDISREQRPRKLISKLTNDFAHLSGQAFYEAVCRYMAETLKLEYVFVGVTTAAGDYVDVVGGWGLGTALSPFSYALAGTPCEQVTHNDACAITRNVQSNFPEDELLTEMGIESYAGVPLVDAQNGRLGIFVGLSTACREDGDEIVNLLQFAVARISSEILRKLAETKLQLAANVFSHAREGITITDAAGAIIEVNDTFCQVTGYSRDELIGQNPRMLQSGRQSPAFYAAMWRELTVEGHWTGEIWNRRKNGEIFVEMLTISAVCNDAGKIQNYVALFNDITLMKEHQQQLERIAHYDGLTNLPNRVLLADRLQQAMTQSERHKHSLAVVYLDLDGFKAVNDTFGHDTGDELLIAVSHRMKEALREGDTLARIGGDEFVAVLVDLDQMTDCEPVLTRLLHAAAEPVAFNNTKLQVSASIGVAIYPQDNADADLLMRHADQAMYAAKQCGKNRYHFFDVQQDFAFKTQRESLEHIRQALEQGEFVLYYQPKVNMKTGKVIGSEALIRWQHPKRGLLQPADFLHIIENHPLSLELGVWVIDTALAQMEAWQRMELDIPVSVNVSAYQLQQQDFITQLSALLAKHPGVQPGCLELEILETSILEDMAEVSTIMHACRNIGVRFALDDFGTGYSSLTYLKHLPADILKIDRSFVRDMLEDSDDLAIINGVIGLAEAFQRQVIAEGVETVAHGKLLLSIGCKLAQGYGIARPMPASDFPGWVATWRPDAAWIGS